MIKVIYESKSNKLYGCCKKCCTRVECDIVDTIKDTEKVGLLYVACPCCKSSLYVNSCRPNSDITYA